MIRLGRLERMSGSPLSVELDEIRRRMTAVDKKKRNMVLGA